MTKIVSCALVKTELNKLQEAVSEFEENTLGSGLVPEVDMTTQRMVRVMNARIYNYNAELEEVCETEWMV